MSDDIDQEEHENIQAKARTYQKESQTMNSPKNHHVLYCDGSAQPNPGHGAGSYVLYQDGKVVDGAGIYLGDHVSNNVAEYAGLIVGLQAAATQSIKAVDIRMDSQLVVNQVLGRWKVKQSDLRQYQAQAVELLRRFPQWSLTCTPREGNSAADKLANTAAMSRHNIDAGDIIGTEQTPDARTERILGAIGDFLRTKGQQNREKATVVK